MKIEPLFDFSLKDPRLFKEAIGYSATATGFTAEMIEKDYFCTLVLDHLAAWGRTKLVFKGGTCLSKVHSDFYRLSEDLDFTLPMPFNSSRKTRSNAASPVKELVDSLPDRYPSVRIEQHLIGANESTQYIGLLSYKSIFGQGAGKIKIEIALREPLLEGAAEGIAKTILLNPVTNSPLLPSIRIPSMSLKESMAEKLRAALTRSEVAIRDFYDIGHIIRSSGFDCLNDEFVNLLRGKLSVPGNGAPDISGVRLANLESQLEPRLRPVLRSKDFEDFDLKGTAEIVKNVARALRR